MIKKFKNPIVFSLVLLPVSLAGGFFTSLYLAESYDAQSIQKILSSAGLTDISILHIITAVQTAFQVFIMSFSGYILAEKLGLMKKFSFKKDGLISTLLLTAVPAIVFIVLEYGCFCRLIPEAAAIYDEKPTIAYMISCLTYGGIIEEIMMRLFLLSLIAFIIWKLFFRNRDTIPEKVLVAANITAALLFALGHLPSTLMLFGEITPLILIRCIVLNSMAGLVCGHLYINHGIQYAMLSHMGFHIIWKLVWILFI